MISFELYNVLHLIGVIAVFLALGGLAAHALNGGTRETNRARGWLAGWHGLGLLIILVGGFGMLARLGMSGGFPGWVWAKLVIWVLIGASIAVIGRRPAMARLVWIGVAVLGTLAAWLAIYKPF